MGPVVAVLLILAFAGATAGAASGPTDPGIRVPLAHAGDIVRFYEPERPDEDLLIVEVLWSTQTADRSGELRPVAVVRTQAPGIPVRHVYLDLDSRAVVRVDEATMAGHHQVAFGPWAKGLAAIPMEFAFQGETFAPGMDLTSSTQTAFTRMNGFDDKDRRLMQYAAFTKGVDGMDDAVDVRITGRAFLGASEEGQNRLFDMPVTVPAIISFNQTIRLVDGNPYPARVEFEVGIVGASHWSRSIESEIENRGAQAIPFSAPPLERPVPVRNDRLARDDLTEQGLAPGNFTPLVAFAELERAARGDPTLKEFQDWQRAHVNSRLMGIQYAEWPNALPQAYAESTLVFGTWDGAGYGVATTFHKVGAGVFASTKFGPQSLPKSPPELLSEPLLTLGSVQEHFRAATWLSAGALEPNAVSWGFATMADGAQDPQMLRYVALAVARPAPAALPYGRPVGFGLMFPTFGLTGYDALPVVMAEVDTGLMPYAILSNGGHVPAPIDLGPTGDGQGSPLTAQPIRFEGASVAGEGLRFAFPVALVAAAGAMAAWARRLR